MRYSSNQTWSHSVAAQEAVKLCIAKNSLVARQSTQRLLAVRVEGGLERLLCDFTWGQKIFR